MPKLQNDTVGNLTLDVSEDAYLGNAQFTVTIDGKQAGGIYTATALHAAGQTARLTLPGTVAAGQHSVAVTFINDLWSGTPTTDRNLYVDAVTLNGVKTDFATPLYSNGTTAFTVGTPVPVTGNLILTVSEDAYRGDAKFTVSVDGKQVGEIYTATALHAAGQTASLTLPGTVAAGQHSVAVTFINDAWGGTAATDRNLYVDAVTLNGVKTSFATPLYSNGTLTITVGPAPTSTPASVLPAASKSFQYLGVNLAGAEFGTVTPTNPGRVNFDYTYPTHAELDYYASKRLNVIRLPFSWERLQPTQSGALDKAQLGYIDDIVRYAETKGLSVVLDPHNYGYGYGNLIGSAGTPDSAFANLWSQLAGHYASTPNVMFGLMNEPHAQTAAQWVQPVNDAISAIRATGAMQEILVPGTAYDGAASWLGSGNASIFAANVRDPGNNMAFEIHSYSDADGSGSSASVVSPTIGADRLKDVTAWAEQTGHKLFLGEFGAGSDQASITNLSNMLSYMQQHTDVWQGGTEWGGGPWWGNYFFATDPTNGTTTPQIVTLASFHS